MKSPLLLAVTICAVPRWAIAQPPRAISRVVPVYPFECRKDPMDSAVLVTFTVTARGQVVHAVVGQASIPVFAEPALAAVRKWQFRPGLDDGRAVETQVIPPFRFVMPRPFYSSVTARR